MLLFCEFLRRGWKPRFGGGIINHARQLIGLSLLKGLPLLEPLERGEKFTPIIPKEPTDQKKGPPI